MLLVKRQRSMLTPNKTSSHSSALRKSSLRDYQNFRSFHSFFFFSKTTKTRSESNFSFTKNASKRRSQNFRLAVFSKKQFSCQGSILKFPSFSNTAYANKIHRSREWWEMQKENNTCRWNQWKLTLRNPTDRKFLASEKACKCRYSGNRRPPDGGSATNTSLIAPATCIYSSISHFHPRRLRALESRLFHLVIEKERTGLLEQFGCRKNQNLKFAHI